MTLPEAAVAQTDDRRRVVVLGGYGGFGGRIAARLVEGGYDVIVAGRSHDRATAFCRGRSGMRPLAVDRDRDLEAALAAERPFAVVDAAGPFQGASYRVARACIAARCHYIDIADGRDFVAGVGSLDGDARAAGISVLSGASSVPTLSGAVVRELAAGLDAVRSVEMAISASNRATAGPSVTRAILTYAGRPIRLWRAGRWTARPGWADLRRQGFAVDGIPPIAPRLVALADVPDLVLVPGRLSGRPAVTFRAGTEFAASNLGIWLLSWLVRSGILASLVPFAPLLIGLHRLTSGWGSDRSGMIVRVFGGANGRRLERRWTLIASDGDGPEIPGLAVPILLQRLARGELQPGARDTGELLGLADFEPAFARLAVRHQITEWHQEPPLYLRVMGERFHALPPTVRAMHDVLRDSGASGRAEVERGPGMLARLVAEILRFPRAGEHPLHVAFSEEDGTETWTRDFGGRSFRSRLSDVGGRLVERFGLLAFTFDLPADTHGLRMQMTGWRLGPIPMPMALAPRTTAREWQDSGQFRFDVGIALPLIGLVVRYQGWLAPCSIEANDSSKGGLTRNTATAAELSSI